MSCEHKPDWSTVERDAMYATDATIRRWRVQCAACREWFPIKVGSDLGDRASSVENRKDDPSRAR